MPTANIKTDGTKWFVYVKATDSYNESLIATGESLRGAVDRALASLTIRKAELTLQEDAVLMEANKCAASRSEPALSWSELVGGADDPSGGE